MKKRLVTTLEVQNEYKNGVKLCVSLRFESAVKDELT